MLSAQHFLQRIVFKMRVLLNNHQVIKNLDGIIAVLLHDINCKGVLRWIGLMPLEISWSENGSKCGQFLVWNQS